MLFVVSQQIISALWCFHLIIEFCVAQPPAILFIYSVESVCSLVTPHKHKMMCTKSCFVRVVCFFLLTRRIFIHFVHMNRTEFFVNWTVFREIFPTWHMCMCKHLQRPKCKTAKYFHVKRHTFICGLIIALMLIKWREATFFFSILDYRPFGQD